MAITAFSPRQDPLWPFIQAVNDGHLEEISPHLMRQLLQEGQINANTKDENGETLLFVAARKGRLEIVRALVEVGEADVNASNNNCETPLIAAGIGGHTAVVEYLLLQGTDPYYLIKHCRIERFSTEVQVRILAATNNPRTYSVRWTSTGTSEEAKSITSQANRCQLDELQRRMHRIVTGVHAEIHASLQVAAAQREDHPILDAWRILPEELRLYTSGRIARGAVQAMINPSDRWAWSLQGRALLQMIPFHQYLLLETYIKKTGNFSPPSPALIEKWLKHLA